MEKLIVTLIYSSQEPDGYEPTSFRLTKEFDFEQLPKFECRIIVHGSVIKHLSFKDVTYDPYKNIYMISQSYCRGVERYYSGEAIDIMKPKIRKFIEYGWRLK